jgi:K+-sensing histidine kinase KdpD
MRNTRRLQRLAADILDVTKIESESLNLKDHVTLLLKEEEKNKR